MCQTAIQYGGEHEAHHDEEVEAAPDEVEARVLQAEEVQVLAAQFQAPCRGWVRRKTPELATAARLAGRIVLQLPHCCLTWTGHPQASESPRSRQHPCVLPL